MDKQKTICRTMKVPVAEILGDHTRNQMYKAIRKSERICIAASNVALSHCASLDQDAWGKDKVPKCPKLYSYPIVSGMFPPGCSQFASSISRQADKKYRQERFAILTGRKSLPMQRNCPVPLLSNKGHKNLRLGIDDQGNVTGTMKLMDGEEYKIRLRGGSNYARPLRTVKAAIESDNIGDSKIWIDRKGKIMLGIACKFEPTKRKGVGTMKVSTDREYFIVATKSKTTVPFSISGDHVKRWIAERKRRQERLRQDSKAGAANSRLKTQRAVISQKFHCRMRSFIQETVAHIVAHASRRGYASIEYNATIRSYFQEAFPWHEFAATLANKCEEKGLAYEEVTSEIIPAMEWEPHVYFAMAVADGKAVGRVKIGYTDRTRRKRMRELEGAGGHELVLLATEKLPQTKLRAREKELHAKFAKVKSDNGVGREWFTLDPVVAWLRETGCLGNTGNLSQITQVLEV